MTAMSRIGLKKRDRPPSIIPKRIYTAFDRLSKRASVNGRAPTASAVTWYNIPMMPRVSVVIPVYNRSGFLKDAIESVLAQTVTDLELVVVDDGSTDDTLETAARSAELDDRVRVISTEHTGFPGAARNRGVEASSARIIAFLDSDDLWLPRKIEKQLPLHEEDEACFSHTEEVWVRDDRVVSQAHRRHRREGDLFEVSLAKCVIGPSTVMIARNLFEQSGGFRNDLEVGEDYELWLRLTDRVKVAHVSEALTVKRGGHPDQLSGRYGQIEIFRITALKAIVDSNGLSEPHLRLARGELAAKCMIYAGGARKRGRHNEADTYERLAPIYLQSAG